MSVDSHCGRPSAELLVRIDPRAPDGLQQQVSSAVRRAILDGVLLPGTRLPSSRTLALDMRVSRTTTLLAYDQLLAEGYLTARQGSGTFVADELPDDLPQRRVRRRVTAPSHPQLSRRGMALAGLPGSARRLGGPPRAFRLGVPALDLFPLRAWSQIVARRLRATTYPALDYADLAGFRDLRQAIADHVQAARAMTCTADQVVIVSGAQRALQMIGGLLLDPGDRVWLEEPGYVGARSAMMQAGAEIVPVRVDAHGMDIAEALRRAPDARAAYVTPSNQFPLGVPMSPARRLALLKWAGTSGAWIVEDDYDSEFRYTSRPFPSLHGLDADGRVLYVGSFAKSICPAMRLGFLVVPLDLQPQFLAARRAADMSPPLLEQMALADFIGGGLYARHLRRMRSACRERVEALIDAAKTFCEGGLRLRPIQTGLHAVADLDGVDEGRVCDEATNRGIEVAPLSLYYLGRRKASALVLGFASMPPEGLRRGMARLAEAIEAARRPRRAEQKRLVAPSVGARPTPRRLHDPDRFGRTGGAVAVPQPTRERL
jgi:GntR family transcriptional regulator/MocR family aminotransferase